MVLDDNIFYGNGFVRLLRESVENAEANRHATVFGYYVTNPRQFGVIEFDESGKVVSVEAKSESPKSNYAIMGLYFYPLLNAEKYGKSPYGLHLKTVAEGKLK